MELAHKCLVRSIKSTGCKKSEGEPFKCGKFKYLYFRTVDKYIKLCIRDDCSNISPTERYCSKHIISPSSKLCTDPQCTGEKAYYGDRTERLRLFCKKHAPKGYIYIVTRKKCKKCNIIPIFGAPGTKIGEFCLAHKPTHYVDVCSRKCTECSKCPSFAPEGTKRGIRCGDHRKPGDENVEAARCRFEDCKTVPTFGVRGTKTRLFCVKHKTDVHIDLSRVNCTSDGCEKEAVYAINFNSPAIVCHEHKDDDYVPVVGCICKENECPKFAIYGIKGTKKPLYCYTHKLPDHIRVAIKFCQEEECYDQAVFGPVGEKSQYCNVHRKDGHVDLVKKICEVPGCDKGAKCGLLFSKARHCVSHRGNNEYMNRYPICDEENCRNRPCFTNDGTSYPQRCEGHMLLDDINVLEKPCSNCGLEFYIPENRELCNDCFDFVVRRIHKAKENRVKLTLEANNVPFSNYDKRIVGGCSEYRPDFVIDMGSHAIIVEVDENQHRSYACQCEQIRMIQIFNDYGGVPVFFIRFNPDSYINVDGCKQYSYNGREATLLELIQKLQQMNIDNVTHSLVAYYLYYDGYNGIPEGQPVAYE